MIGFTFAMALSRFELRRDAVWDEASAIGTTGLRARLLSAPHNAECLKLLKDYVQVRLDLNSRTAICSRTTWWEPRSSSLSTFTATPAVKPRKGLAPTRELVGDFWFSTSPCSSSDFRLWHEAGV
jgi:hypothetical protein